MTPSALVVARVQTAESDATMEERWRTVAEVAVIWRVHPNTIYRALKAGTFPCEARKVGRVWRIRDPEAQAEGWAAMVAAAGTDPDAES